LVNDDIARSAGVRLAAILVALAVAVAVLEGLAAVVGAVAVAVDEVLAAADVVECGIGDNLDGGLGNVDEAQRPVGHDLENVRGPVAALGRLPGDAPAGGLAQTTLHQHRYQHDHTELDDCGHHQEQHRRRQREFDRRRTLFVSRYSKKARFKTACIPAFAQA
jgi:hypothetical protein